MTSGDGAATARVEPHRILVHDFGGYAFAVELSRELARRGHEVTHAHCGGVTNGKGALHRRPDDPAGLTFVDVQPTPFERYRPAARLRCEVRYGRAVAALTRSLRPDIVVSANTPLLAQAQLWRTARRIGARRIYWLQDFLGRGTRSVLDERSALLGATAGRALEHLERSLLRSSDAVVAISDDFGTELDRMGCHVPQAVIENWAPCGTAEPGPKANPWSEAQGLAHRPVALYSGTLGLKHDPELLVTAVQALAGTDGAVVVITEGRGRDHLERRKAELGLDDLVLLDFVAHDVLDQVIAAADVGLVLLEPEAGTFSVPSKTLTYLAAGRAVVAAMPAANLAARLLDRTGAGVVVTPGDGEAFGEAIAQLLGDPERAQVMGAAGRRHALEAFDPVTITDRFEPVLFPTPPR